MTSAEQKGHELCDWLLDNGRVGMLTSDTRDKIIEALREAENDKLEEAAEEAEGCRVPDGTALGEWAGGFIDGKNAAANSIRSLISKKEPVDLVGIGTAALERGLNSKPKD